MAKEFQEVFKFDERLIACTHHDVTDVVDYTCAHKGGEGIINQGRLYITGKHVCFYSNFLGKITDVR